MVEPARAPHEPVMLDEVLEALAVRPGGRYCDATVGAGGHAEAILARSAPDGHLVAVDRDPTALGLARARLADAEKAGRVTFLLGRFGELDTLLSAEGKLPLEGLLVDLGVSSMQLDDPARGFSFRAGGPIDMRMGPSAGETAAELIERLDEEELADLIARYGEERHASRVARAIKRAQAEGQLGDTRALAEVVSEAIPARERAREQARGGIHPATRTFQALRMAVNDELGELERLLGLLGELLAVGGRVAIIAFHSLEDRLVKERFRALSTPERDPVTGAPRGAAPLRLLWRKPRTPSDAEVQRNPRARSAKLRAAEWLGPAPEVS